MEINWVLCFYVLILLDSCGAVAVAWFGKTWWIRYTGVLGEYFPPAKGWAILYLILVLIIGGLLGFI